MSAPIPAKGTFPFAGHRTVAETHRAELARSQNIARVNARRMAWCPPALRDDYRLLVGRLGAVEARAVIERQIRNDPPNQFANRDCIGGAGLRWIDEQDGRVPQAGPGFRPADHAPSGHGAARFNPIARGGE